MSIAERLRQLPMEDDEKEKEEAKRRKDESLRLLQQQLVIDGTPPKKRSIAQKLEDAKRDCNERERQRQATIQSTQAEYPQQPKRGISR